MLAARRSLISRQTCLASGSVADASRSAKVERLLEAGRMREPVVAALDDSPKAKEFFDSLDRSAQYRLYLPVLQARSPKTRAARLGKVIALLEADEKPR
ncbi:MAG: YdeI/OmpD-associated family protein [Acidimicrobiia bacterium]|nr:YdeI/OmpD-associated family protein [Acidimicrobiia bacterium]